MTAEHNDMVAAGRRIQREAIEVWTAYQRLSPAARILFATLKINHSLGQPTPINPVALARMEKRYG